MGGPGHPRGPGAGACLELLLQGGALMPNANEERSEGDRGLCFPSPPLLWRGVRIKQQQKHRPLGDCGLHPLPSLRSVSASHTSPAVPYGFRKAPYTFGGTLWLARGSTVPTPGHSLSWLLTPPRGGRGGHEACSQGRMALPWPCQQAVALPRLQLCPLGANTPCWADPASHPTLSHPLPQSIMASSISKNSLCMGTLPSSFTP